LKLLGHLPISNNANLLTDIAKLTGHIETGLMTAWIDEELAYVSYSAKDANRWKQSEGLGPGFFRTTV